MKIVAWKKQWTVWVWEVDIVVSVNRLLNFAEFWFTKCRKFVKFLLVNVIESLYCIKVSSDSRIKNWSIHQTVKRNYNVNFTYFLRSIFQIILICLNVVVNGSKEISVYFLRFWQLWDFLFKSLVNSSPVKGECLCIWAWLLCGLFEVSRMQEVSSLEVSALVVLLAVLAVVEGLHHLLVLLGGEHLKGLGHFLV